MTSIIIICSWKEGIRHHFSDELLNLYFQRIKFQSISITSKRSLNVYFFCLHQIMLIIWINFCVCNIVFYLHRSDVVVRLTHLLWSFNDSLQDTLLSIYLLFYISFYVYYIFVSYHHHCRISFFELQSRITSLLHRVLCDIYWGITFLLCSFSPKAQLKRKWIPFLTLRRSIISDTNTPIVLISSRRYYNWHGKN